MKVTEGKYYLNHKEKDDLIKEALNDYVNEDVNIVNDAYNKFRSNEICCRCNKQIEGARHSVEELYDCEGMLVPEDNVLPQIYADSMKNNMICDKCYNELGYETICNKFNNARRDIAG